MAYHDCQISGIHLRRCHFFVTTCFIKIMLLPCRQVLSYVSIYFVYLDTKKIKEARSFPSVNPFTSLVTFICHTLSYCWWDPKIEICRSPNWEILEISPINRGINRTTATWTGWTGILFTNSLRNGAKFYKKHSDVKVMTPSTNAKGQIMGLRFCGQLVQGLWPTSNLLFFYGVAWKSNRNRQLEYNMDPPNV